MHVLRRRLGHGREGKKLKTKRSLARETIRFAVLLLKGSGAANSVLDILCSFVRYSSNSTNNNIINIKLFMYIKYTRTNSMEEFNDYHLNSDVELVIIFIAD